MTNPRNVHTPEHIDSLIARCLAGGAPEAAREIERDGLWEYVAAQACLAEVGGLLADRLRTQGLTPPASAAMQLDAYRDHVAAANAYRLSRAAAVLTHLAAEGVPFLLL